MPFHRHRHFRRPGGPEFIGLLTVALTLASAFLWWRTETSVDWPTTAGKVLSTNIQNMHYNATKYGNRVEIRYEYAVGDRPYVGHWIGYWPVVESPNALPADRMGELKVRGYPLVVMYHPTNPSISRLHDSAAGRRRFLAGTTVAAASIAFLYLGMVYPRLRKW